MSWRNAAPTFSKTYGRKTVSSTMSSKNHLVAVFQKRAVLAIGKLEGRRTPVCELQEATHFVPHRARNSSATV